MKDEARSDIYALAALQLALITGGLIILAVGANALGVYSIEWKTILYWSAATLFFGAVAFARALYIVKNEKAEARRVDGGVE